MPASLGSAPQEHRFDHPYLVRMRASSQPDLFSVESSTPVALTLLPPPSPALAAMVHVVPGRREIDDYICGILSAIEYEPGKTDGSILAKLTCGQIERYAEVDEILKRIGGKWLGRQKAHLFPFDPAEVIAAIAEGGLMPAKNPLAYFPTPLAVIEKIFADQEIADHLSYLEAHTNHRVLEPSAGTGAFVKYLLARYPGLKGRIDCVEVDPLKCRVLEKLEAGAVFQAKYEDWTPLLQYAAVIMNPPFSTPGDKTAYITHITKAVDHLQGRYGLLVAIAPTGFATTDNKPMRAFRNLVAETGSIVIQPKGDFKESGTGIETCTITLFTSLEPLWRNAPYQGYTSWHSFSIDVFITNERDLHGRLTEIGRLSCANETEEVDALVDSLITAACNHLWRESQALISMRDDLKAGIRQDLLASARAIAQDLLAHAAA
jgi:hypothetical protein